MQCSHPTQYPDVHPIYDLSLNCNFLFLSEIFFACWSEIANCIDFQCQVKLEGVRGLGNTTHSFPWRSFPSRLRIPLLAQCTSACLSPLQIGLLRTIPQIGLLRTILQIGLLRTIPQIGLLRTILQIGLLRTIPQIGLLRTIPQIGLLRTIPQIGLLKTIPQIGLLRTIPQIGLLRTIPQIGLLRTIPQIGLLRTIPQIGLLKTIPSLGGQGVGNWDKGGDRYTGCGRRGEGKRDSQGGTKKAQI